MRLYIQKKSLKIHKKKCNKRKTKKSKPKSKQGIFRLFFKNKKFIRYI